MRGITRAPGDWRRTTRFLVSSQLVRCNSVFPQGPWAQSGVDRFAPQAFGEKRFDILRVFAVNV